MTNLNGILPALVTPLLDDETLNVAAFEKLLERVYTAGVDGVYVCGSTGEGLALPSAERRKVVEIAVKNSPRGKQVIVHAGAWSVAESQALVRHAAGAGAAAVSALRPAGTSFAELIEYYRSLAAATDLPFLAYYFPSSADSSLTYDQLSTICALPGVAGLKFTDYDLYTLSSLVRDGNVMFNGRDEILAAGLLMGANGGIGSIYNLIPSSFVELHAHARAGRWTEARALQDKINDLIRVLLRFPFLPALKQVLTWDGIPCGATLRPRLALTPALETELRSALAPFESLVSA
jgi:N-acetylneuraminate lyase